MAFFGKQPENPAPSRETQPHPHPHPQPQPTAPPERTPASPPRDVAPAPPSAGSTTIGSRLKFIGDISGDEDIIVNGRVEGKIRVDRKVVVSAGAEVEGDVQARAVIVGGRIHGQVIASERAELLASGRVQGNVHAPRIVMAEGAQIQGRVVMPNDAAARPLSAPPRTEEAPKRPMAPPKPEDAARPPASPGSGG